VGDAQSGPIRLSFNPQLRVEFRGAAVTSDAGLLLPRELDERVGLSALIASWSGRSRICSPGPGADQVTSRWFATAASSIRRPPGTARAG
jgi:hypothetical protein